MNKNVLVTGGTGFVGSWMQRTQPEGVSALYLSRMDYISYKLNKPGTCVTHPSDKLIYSHIVHLALVPPHLMIMLAKQMQARLLYCSSGIVYHPENNIAYRYDKLMGEKACLDDRELDVVIARPFAFYGEGLDKYKAYSQFTEAAKANKPIEIQGDGQTVRSYMHAGDLGRWLWAILLNGQCGEAYDVGSDEPITMIQLAKKIQGEHNSNAGIVFKHGDDPMPYYLPPNTDKTRRLLDVEVMKG